MQKTNTKKTNTEKIVTEINSNVFFKEFTFSENDFRENITNQKLEFADNVIWIDEILFVFQIKDRENINQDDVKWFNNKILKKAVSQIKDTLKYISDYPEVIIENEKGHKLDIIKASNCQNIKKIIVYTPNPDFPENLRNLKFYNSQKIGLVHLFHSEDYYWICKYLLTPSEIEEYLDFRENLYLANVNNSLLLPEQYFLSHFMETLDVSHLNPKYIENLNKIPNENEEFDLKLFLNSITGNFTGLSYNEEYYPIIKEIAKLNRTELIEFKKRFKKAMEKCDAKIFIKPYRFFSQRTDCCFVFIPLNFDNRKSWENILKNLVVLNKYDLKAKKSIGFICFKSELNLKDYQTYWFYFEKDWEFSQEINDYISKESPLRELKVNIVQNRYK